MCLICSSAPTPTIPKLPAELGWCSGPSVLVRAQRVLPGVPAGSCSSIPAHSRPCHHIAAAWLSAPSPKDNGDPRGEILQCQPFPGILPCSKLLDQLLGTAADVPGHLLVLCCPLSLVASLPCLTDHCGFSPGFQQEAKVTALETKQKGHKSSKEIGK